MTVDSNGLLTFDIQARQRIEILGLPAGTQATITEEMTANQDQMFDVVYRTRNHSGEDADDNNEVIIPVGANATTVITNEYTPKSTSVDLDIKGTKNFHAEDGAILPGGTFNSKVQKAVWNNADSEWTWEDVTGKTAQVTSKLEKKVETPTTPATPSAPKTGDATSVGTWSTLTFASIMVCGAILVIEKKRKGEI